MKLHLPPIILSIGLLGVAVYSENAPSGFFTLLRIVIFLTSIYLSHSCFTNGLRGHGWFFLFVLILFNPLIPIHLGRKNWMWVDFVLMFILYAEIFWLQKFPKGPKMRFFLMFLPIIFYGSIFLISLYFDR